MSFYTDVSLSGNNILFRGYSDSGKKVIKKVKFKPKLYVQGQENKSDWVGLYGSPLSEMEFDSISDSQEFIKQYKDVNNFDIYGNISPINQFITRTWPEDIKFDYRLIDVYDFDIEVESEEGFPKPEEAAYPVISIVSRRKNSNVYKIWAYLDDYDVGNAKDADLPEGCVVEFIKCKDELDLLIKFIQDFSSDYPDIITGWFVKLFDVTYMCNRIKRVLGDEWLKKMSPWGQVRSNSIAIQGRTHEAYELTGIQQMDYLDVFKKFGYKYGTQESYKLDHIAYVVLGKKKLSYEEAGNLFNLISTSKNVSYPKDVNISELPDFQQKARLRDKYKDELIKRGLSVD